MNSTIKLTRNTLIATLWIGIASCLAVAQTPSISSLSVASGVTGTAVTITGANFGTNQGTVTFNGAAAAVSSWTGGNIAVTVPAAATTGSVVVKAGGVASNGVTFTVVPNISGLLVNGAPSNAGPIGATVTINGTGFGNTAGFSTVTLNTVALAGNGVRATSWSDQSIVVVIPSTATSGNIVVKVGSQSSGGVRFSIGPVITGISPSSGLAGSGVTVTGSGFGTATGTVTFNGQSATVSGWGQNSITAVVPGGATAGPIVVTVAGVASNNSATFTPTPAITSLSPSSGLSGTQVTIAGSSFGNQQGTSTVSFNGVAAAVSNWTNTGITVTAPSGALTGNVQVAVNGVSSAGVPFTFTPVITSITPSPALAQTLVTIGGSNFGGSQSTSTVSFNGVAAAVSNWTNTSITATVPGNATGGPVVVTVNGVGSNGLAFNLPPPYSFSISYAPNGNVRSAQDSVNGNWTYSYDDFNRLAGSTNNTPQQAFSYTYDQYGNRWQQNVTAGSGNGSLLTFTSTSTAVANGNCYHAAGLTNQPDGYCFDAAGNLLGDGQHNYSYDAENRIIAVDGGQTATYVYNGSGQRIRKVSATARTADYVFDLAGRTVTEVSGQGTWTRLEVYAGGRHLATYNNGTVYFVQTDWEGTERARVLISGDLFEVCTSLPYGDGQQCTGAADPSPDHLTGKQRDTETGLDYFGARYYGSMLGRFITPDWSSKPITVPYANFGDPQSLNLYSYVRNSPLNRTDPTGHYELADPHCAGDAKCQQKYDKKFDDFEKQRQKDLHSKDPRVRAGAAAYGEKGEKNGVHVGFADLGKGIKGYVDPYDSGKGRVIDIEVRFNTDLGGTSLAESIAHEGTHVADQMAFLLSYDFSTGKYNQDLNPAHIMTELRAYTAGAAVTREHGFGPKEGGKIVNFIYNNPAYRNILWDPVFPNNDQFPQAPGPPEDQ